jgi:purine-binding chemotaxis protein CheW
MIVDSVSEVVQIPGEAIEPPPAIVATPQTAYLTGIAKLDGDGVTSRLVSLLDLRKILSLPEAA